MFLWANRNRFSSWEGGAPYLTTSEQSEMWREKPFTIMIIKRERRKKGRCFLEQRDHLLSAWFKEGKGCLLRALSLE